MDTMKKNLIDLGERTLATFAQAFLAAVTLGSMTDAGALKLAGIAGAYAVAKFLLVQANSWTAAHSPAPITVNVTPPAEPSSGELGTPPASDPAEPEIPPVA